MARDVFRRTSSSGATKGPLSVAVTELAQRRRVLCDPGVYWGTIEEATLVESARRGGNVSIALTIRNAGVDVPVLFDLRPLWISGPNAHRGNMAARNFGIVADLLAAAGVAAADSYTELTGDMLGRLRNVTFELRLAAEEGRDGRTFNVIDAVFGRIDPDLGTAPAASPRDPT